MHRKAVLQLFVLIPHEIMAVYTLWEDYMNSTISCQMQKVDSLPSSLYLCYLKLCLYCAEISIHAFIRFPVASKASS